MATSFRIPGPSGRKPPLDEEEFISTRRLIPQAGLPQKEAAFKNINRADLHFSLRVREKDASKIDQRATSLCGPAALMYLTAKHRPSQYAQYVLDLYENGTAHLGKLQVRPSKACKNFRPFESEVAAADWVALAGLRDSENLVFDYKDPGDNVAGVTLPSTLARWLTKVGFSEVSDHTNLVFTKGEKNLRQAAQMFRDHYEVCLLVHQQVIENPPSVRGVVHQARTFPSHWIVLTSDIAITKESVSFTVYSWGQDNRPVPYQSWATMTLKEWLQSYYGFVACKP
jgi:hypothetical protein